MEMPRSRLELLVVWSGSTPVRNAPAGLACEPAITGIIFLTHWLSRISS